MTMKLYVGNLAYQTSSEALERLFAQAGTVESSVVVADRNTGRSRGFGFVEMASKEEGQAAITRFNGQEVDGRNLTVTEAKPFKDGGSSPGSDRERDAPRGRDGDAAGSYRSGRW